jgi:hypothetical protein
MSRGCGTFQWGIAMYNAPAVPPVAKATASMVSGSPRRLSRESLPSPASGDESDPDNCAEPMCEPLSTIANSLTPPFHSSRCGAAQYFSSRWRPARSARYGIVSWDRGEYGGTHFVIVDWAERIDADPPVPVGELVPTATEPLTRRMAHLNTPSAIATPHLRR